MKKKKSSGGANWMDTYGDMVTLLLCFFVLLYSMSTISEENWKALVMSFNPKAMQQVTQTPGGTGPSADEDLGAGVMEFPSDKNGGQDSQDTKEAQEEIDNMIEQIYEMLQQYRAAEGLENTLSVSMEGGRVFVRFNTTTFFNGDSAVLRDEAYPILEHVSTVLSQASEAIDEVRIQGHTAQANPGRPNNIEKDLSLSTDRANSVRIYIQTNSDVDPARLISEGYGQWRPIASNDTEEGRSQNRRVEMVISGRNLLEELGSDNLQQYDTEFSTT